MSWIQWLLVAAIVLGVACAIFLRWPAWLPTLGVMVAILAAIALLTTWIFTPSQAAPTDTTSPGTSASTSPSPSPSTPSTSASPSSPSPSTSEEVEGGEDTDTEDGHGTDVWVPATNADLHRSEFDALVARCGSELGTEHLAKNKVKDDKFDFVLFGSGKAFTSWKDYECVVMTYPHVAHMWAAGWVNQKAPSGKTFGDVNPWMRDALDNSKGSLMKAWVLTGTDGTLKVSEAYQRWAFNVVTLLNRPDRSGKAVAAKAVWHRPADNARVEGLPKTFKSTKPYAGKFITLSFSQKGQKCPFSVYGINVNDGRMAKLNVPCGEKPGKPGEPGKPGKPGKPKPPKCPPGKYCKAKKPAKQPDGVEIPTNNPVGEPTEKPTPKATPLQPGSSGGSGGGGTDGHTTTQPNEGGGATNIGGPATDG